MSRVGEASRKLSVHVVVMTFLAWLKVHMY